MFSIFKNLVVFQITKAQWPVLTFAVFDGLSRDYLLEFPNFQIFVISNKGFADLGTHELNGSIAFLQLKPSQLQLNDYVRANTSRFVK